MQTVSSSETSLATLIEKARLAPVLIQEGGEDVAVLQSAESYRQGRAQKVKAFERARDAMAFELAENLAKEGLTPEEFLEDLLRD